MDCFDVKDAGDLRYEKSALESLQTRLNSPGLGLNLRRFHRHPGNWFCKTSIHLKVKDVTQISTEKAH
jgi:hypothetical protein